MRSIPLTMTFEMLQRGKWGLIGIFLYVYVFPSFVFSALLRTQGFDLHDPGVRALHMLFPPLSMFAIAASIVAAQGPPKRLFVYPVKTSTIVAWHMCIAIVGVFVEYVLSVAMLNAVFELDWPLWGPALFAAAAVAALQATLWLTEETVWFPICLAIVSGILGTWYYTRFSPSTGLWVSPSLIEVATLGLVIVIAYFVGVAGVARSRCGEKIKPLGILAWLIRILDINPLFEPKFQTPRQAQFWFEWRRKGLALPSIAVFVLFIYLTGWAIFSRDPRNLIEGFAYVGPAYLMCGGLLFGVVSGSVGSNKSGFQMGHFLASRPLNNSDFGRIVLKVIGTSVVTAWCIWAVGFLISFAVLSLAGFSPQLPKEIYWWYFPATLVGCWTFVATGASICLAGRPMVFVAICLHPAVYLFGAFFGAYLLPEETLSRISDALIVVCSIGLIPGTCLVFMNAKNRSLIGTRTVSLGLCIYLILATFIVVEMTRHPVERFPGCIILVGLAALTVFPLAAAPLAISWNRTR